MEKEELIIHLIEQDLRHNILALGLENLQFSGVENYDLNLISAISSLMGIEKGETSDEWSITYHDYMLRASELKAGFEIDGLEELATECYDELQKTLSPE